MTNTTPSPDDEERIANQRRESARWMHISEVRDMQQGLFGTSDTRLIMLGLAELIAFMPKDVGIGPMGSASREALYRELLRRGMGVERLERGR